jgi:uncharacterized protein
MTVYVAMRSGQNWRETLQEPEPHYQKVVFTQGEVPLAGWVAIPDNPKGTVVGTYGITGNLDNQWFLRILGSKAFAQNYAVVLFDWRAHGESAKLSAVLTSDGINEYCSRKQDFWLSCAFLVYGLFLGGTISLMGNLLFAVFGCGWLEC